MFSKAVELQNKIIEESKRLDAASTSMLCDLAAMLQMQRQLDESIYKEKGITEYPKDKVELALFVELGELLNEMPSTFKYWKDTATDNKEKALEEYVDCLHFALSLTNSQAERTLNILKKDAEIPKLFALNHLKDMFLFGYDPDGEIGTSVREPRYLVEMIMESEEYILAYLFDLGITLGFTWPAIVAAYKMKNAVNYKRLENNY